MTAQVMKAATKPKSALICSECGIDVGEATGIREPWALETHKKNAHAKPVVGAPRVPAQVRCSKCGHIQPDDNDHWYCLKCGSRSWVSPSPPPPTVRRPTNAETLELRVRVREYLEGHPGAWYSRDISRALGLDSDQARNIRDRLLQHVVVKRPAHVVRIFPVARARANIKEKVRAYLLSHPAASDREIVDAIGNLAAPKTIKIYAGHIRQERPLLSPHVVLANDGDPVVLTAQGRRHSMVWPISSGHS